MKKFPCILVLMLMSQMVLAQPSKLFLFDISHGQNPKIARGWSKLLLPQQPLTSLDTNTLVISKSVLKKTDVLVLFSPTKVFESKEKEAIINYLNKGGSLLLIFDEERRTPLSVGVNDIIIPFGLELTENVSAPHNCGALAEKNEVCSNKRELPYSGGRSIKGGHVISKVYHNGEFVHCSYVALNAGGKIMVMSDGMAGLLLGEPDGERLSGTGPTDTKYWGKDSEVFMKEVLVFMIN